LTLNVQTAPADQRAQVKLALAGVSRSTGVELLLTALMAPELRSVDNAGACCTVAASAGEWWCAATTLDQGACEVRAPARARVWPGSRCMPEYAAFAVIGAYGGDYMIGAWDSITADQSAGFPAIHLRHR
jgi:hypothetical protein